MAVRLTGLRWAVLETPRTPEELIVRTQECARVHPDAITHGVISLWATGRARFRNGRWERVSHTLTLRSAYRACKCGRQIAVEIGRCHRCREVRA